MSRSFYGTGIFYDAGALYYAHKLLILNKIVQPPPIDLPGQEGRHAVRRLPGWIILLPCRSRQTGGTENKVP